MTTRLPLVLPLAALTLATPAGAEEAAFLLRCGRLLDPASGRTTAGAAVLVRAGRVERTGTDLAAPAGATVVDLAAFTCLPGLIDAHTHVLLQPEDERGVPPIGVKTQAYRVIQGVAAARADLEAGFTTQRDLDSEGAGFADVALRDAIARGVVPGPRLLVSTLALTITGGHMNNVGINPELEAPEPSALVDSRQAAVAEVRRQVKRGADWIKVYATGALRHVEEATLTPLPQFSQEDLEAIVAEARRWRRDVAAHAYGGEGARNAIRAGVRSIEHGMLLDDETVRLMAERGTYWAPTLSVYLPDHPEDDTPFRRRIVAAHEQSFRRALAAGVKIAFGTDVGAFAHGTAAREFPLMVRYGMSPLEALRSATVRAAELLRMEGKVGTLAPFAFADVIAVEGDPLQDVEALRRVVFVMKSGQVVKAPR